MKIDKAKEVLEVLQGVDINECAVFAEGDNNQLRAISGDKSTVIFTEVEKFVDTQLGVLSVKGLLSRINLFDMEKAGVKEDTNDSDNGEYISELTIKEGRRRSKVKTTHPKRLAVPTKYPESGTVFKAYVTKDYIDYIAKMKASISAVPSQEELTFSLGFDGNTDENTIVVSIGGGYDSFRDEVEGEVITDSVEFNATWKIDPVMRVLKRASNQFDPEDTIEIIVNDIGMMEINANGVMVSISCISSNNK